MGNPHETELGEGARDLGPLAWVLEELRKSLDGATRALRRFARDAELARGSDIESLDTSQLRGARQQLHQAVGALDMVDLPAPARMVRLMESAAQRFIAHPELCGDAAVQRLDRASFALTEYLEGSLKGRLVSCVALFVPYRDVGELAGAERIHPADLWSPPRAIAGTHLALPVDIAPLVWSTDLRSRIDVGMLRVMQGSRDAAAVMRDCALGLGAAALGGGLRNFWVVAAGFFDALASQRCALDVYSKRAVSALLLQARILARGDDRLSERLQQDLLFFCAQAAAAEGHPAAVLDAVRQQCGLDAHVPVDYQESRFGRFDPTQLTQARKRIAVAAESWSALSGGDTNRLRLVGEQFALVTESLLKLHPQCRGLAQALNAAIEGVVRSGEAPGPALGIEVATAVHYMEAV
jgi:chemosensory pili system protein ChpA (sensor histidine kinase/response regulator)